MDSFKLNLKTLEFIYKDSKLPDLGCYDLHELVTYFFKHDMIKTPINDIEDKYVLDVYGSYDAVSFSLTSLEFRDSLHGYATPYYDGRCRLPIDFDSYIQKEENSIKEQNIGGMYHKIIPLKNIELSTFSEIKEWIENDYVQILIDYCEPIFEEIREGNIY